MAEFTEVMKQAKRMCDARNGECPGCGLWLLGCTVCAMSGIMTCGMAKEAERIVMLWAAEHPEPRYPTWKEWHDTMFAESFVKEVPCPKFFLDQARGEILCAENEDCPDCWSNPIPADVAEKLGVKPIGET